MCLLRGLTVSIGMATRLATQLGLDLDSTYEGLPLSEYRLRQYALYSCVVGERFEVLVPY